MIGGSDVTISTTGGAAALDFCVRTICREWPSAVFEDSVTESLVHKYSDLPLSFAKELFVYKDAQAAQSWRQLGADASNQNTMIHLMLSPMAVTIVVDDQQDDAIARILSTIGANLRRDLLTMRAAA